MLDYDFDRVDRIGMPEAILCDSKAPQHVERIIAELADADRGPVLLTRLAEDRVVALPESLVSRLDYDVESRTAFLNGRMPPREGSVVIVSAGTSDIRVAREAARTLDFLGIEVECITDVGVAGIHRLFNRLDRIREADVVIAVAGMDAALASVLGGLVAQPVIGVPTSTGYGAAHDGQTALNAMLASCAQGVVVTNIDNGFGAACAASRILPPTKVAP